MQMHDPICLEGPVTKDRPWWRTAAQAARAAVTSQPDPCPVEEPLFRAGLVEEIRREIAAGSYETPEKWEAALDRLLDRLERE
ncbi:MAG TPA: flagellar biosynthesis anti-sigma factor FlgM [Gemmataceae bacterium]|nr:flagellar biosynthesis anti-sigma factor FlgM [Gemmataceae bacterium]